MIVKSVEWNVLNMYEVRKCFFGFESSGVIIVISLFLVFCFVGLVCFSLDILVLVGFGFIGLGFLGFIILFLNILIILNLFLNVFNSLVSFL